VISWRKWMRGGLSSRPRGKQSKAKGKLGDPMMAALQAAAIAEAEDDADGMLSASYKLVRLELYGRAWELRMRAAALEQPSPLPEWDGGDLAGRTLLIRSYAPKNRVGEDLRLSRFIGQAARRADRCIALAEPRLVPLLRRSFPGVDVRPRGVDEAAALAEADVVAHYETIAFYYAKNAADMRASLVPLQADPTLAASLRQRYKNTADARLVGISWGSSNSKKALPDLMSWEPLLSWPSANFVSLQYGDIEHDLEVLRRLAGGRVTHDTGINQLVDLDGFAAQIAALDAVVSIGNTTIDMAGMLGVPTLHIRDDDAYAIWPASGPSPWYPDMLFLYKQQRPWKEVFEEARTSLERMLPTATSMQPPHVNSPS
jgi:hypothetical protein